MDLIAWAGSRLLDGLSFLPYFRGKGLLALTVVRLCGRSHRLVMRLPNGSRVWVGNDNAGHLLLPYLIGKYEHKTTQIFLQHLHFLQAGTDVVDVGANVGYYALMAAWHLRQRREGTVYAFEPNPHAFEYLQQNINLNRLTNLIAIQQGVADKCTQMTLYLNPDGITFGSLEPYVPHLTESCEISVTTLDHFLSLHPESRIGLMKIDIEGAELLALQGGENTLLRDRPVIIYEENRAALSAFGCTVADLRDFLQAKGYRLYEIEKLAKETNNILAVPAEKLASLKDV